MSQARWGHDNYEEPKPPAFRGNYRGGREPQQGSREGWRGYGPSSSSYADPANNYYDEPPAKNRYDGNSRQQQQQQQQQQRRPDQYEDQHDHREERAPPARNEHKYPPLAAGGSPRSGDFSGNYDNGYANMSPVSMMPPHAGFAPPPPGFVPDARGFSRYGPGSEPYMMRTSGMDLRPRRDTDPSRSPIPSPGSSGSYPELSTTKPVDSPKSPDFVPAFMEPQLSPPVSSSSSKSPAQKNPVFSPTWLDEQGQGDSTSPTSGGNVGKGGKYEPPQRRWARQRQTSGELDYQQYLAREMRLTAAAKDGDGAGTEYHAATQHKSPPHVRTANIAAAPPPRFRTRDAHSSSSASSPRDYREDDDQRGDAVFRDSSHTGYTRERTYSKGDSYVRDDECFKDSEYQKVESGSKKERVPLKENRYNRDSGYSRDGAYTRDSGYSRESEHPESGYSRESDYSKDSGYSRDHGGYSKDNSYPRDRGYQRDHAKDNRYSRDSNHSKDSGYSHDGGYSRKTEYPSRYSKESHDSNTEHYHEQHDKWRNTDKQDSDNRAYRGKEKNVETKSAPADDVEATKKEIEVDSKVETTQTKTTKRPDIRVYIPRGRRPPEKPTPKISVCQDPFAPEPEPPTAAAATTPTTPTPSTATATASKPESKSRKKKKKGKAAEADLRKEQQQQEQQQQQQQQQKQQQQQQKKKNNKDSIGAASAAISKPTVESEEGVPDNWEDDDALERKERALEMDNQKEAQKTGHAENVIRAEERPKKRRGKFARDQKKGTVGNTQSKLAAAMQEVKETFGGGSDRPSETNKVVEQVHKIGKRKGKGDKAKAVVEKQNEEAVLKTNEEEKAHIEDKAESETIKGATANVSGTESENAVAVDDKDDVPATWEEQPEEEMDTNEAVPVTQADEAAESAEAKKSEEEQLLDSIMDIIDDKDEVNTNHANDTEMLEKNIDGTEIHSPKEDEDGKPQTEENIIDDDDHKHAELMESKTVESCDTADKKLTQEERSLDQESVVSSITSSVSCQAEPASDQAEPTVSCPAEPIVSCQAEPVVSHQAEPTVSCQAEPTVSCPAEPIVSCQAESTASGQAELISCQVEEEKNGSSAPSAVESKPSSAIAVQKTKKRKLKSKKMSASNTNEINYALVNDLFGDSSKPKAKTMADKKPPQKTATKDSGTVKKKHGDGEEEEESWDAMFDDNGDSLDPKVVEELTEAVGNVKVEKTQFDYYNFRPEDPDMDCTEYAHLVEIFDFPNEFRTQDLLMAFKEFQDKGFDIKWVDDTHAIGVFSSSIAACSALALNHPMVKVRPLSQASRQSKTKARKTSEFLQPCKPRPETTSQVAHKLVANALGLRSKVPQGKRDEEKRKLQEARDKKKAARIQARDVWEGVVGKCAMDET